MPPRTPYRAGPPGRPNPSGSGSDLSGQLLHLLRPSNLRVIALGVLVIFGLFGLLPPGEIRGRPEVVDGDSLVIAGDRIRLYAIDAPELHQPCRNGSGACGERARDYLARLVAGHDLLCEKRDTDRYGRDVAQCYISKIDENGKATREMDIGRAMVRAGHAMAYREIDRMYVSDEPGRFDFEPPWDWRESHRR